MNTHLAGDSSKPPTNLLSFSQAEERLKPYKPLLYGCVREAWETWRGDYGDRHHRLQARSRASIVSDEIIFQAEEKFNGLPDVVCKRKGTSFFLFIGPDIVIRFKKIRKNGRCSYIPTNQQKLFATHQLPLAGMEPGTMLHVGYALNDLQTEIVRIAVVCQYSDSIVWLMDLDAGERSHATLRPAQSQPTSGPRWTPKQNTDQKDKKKGKGA